MSDDIRVGDRFLIEVEVSNIHNDLCRTHVAGFRPDEEGGDESDYYWISPEELLSGRRLPRQIKQGDRVTWGAGNGQGTVVYVRGEWAVIDDGQHSGCAIDRPCTIDLSRLTLDDKA